MLVHSLDAVFAVINYFVVKVPLPFFCVTLSIYLCVEGPGLDTILPGYIPGLSCLVCETGKD